ncbi:MAG TPA: MBL fold metallo-hydrolase [Dermatophilaceae bacterium]|nr:MBL fold metallo-hydrolase [Dermatophilaceae bacterium]
MAELVSASVTWWGHSTTTVELAGEVVLTDPVLRRRVGPLVQPPSWQPPAVGPDTTVVLVSHAHRDHLDVPSLAAVSRDALVVGPVGTAALLARGDFERVLEVTPGESVTVGRLTVRAVHAEHDGRRGRWGPAQPAVGYLLEGDGRHVWFAGDTGLHDALEELTGREIDLALVPVGGWGLTVPERHHLDPVRAAEAVRRVHPRAVVPIHWGSLRLPLLWRARPALHDAPGRLFAEVVAATSPDVAVHLPRFGEPVEFG